MLKILTPVTQTVLIACHILSNTRTSLEFKFISGKFCNYNYYYLFRKRFEFNYRYTKPYIRYVNACICTHSIFPFSYQVNYMNIYTSRLAIQDFLIKVECIIIFCPLFGNVNVLSIYYIYLQLILNCIRSTIRKTQKSCNGNTNRQCTRSAHDLFVFAPDP